MEHRTFCRLCPVLCGLVVTTEDDRVVSVRGDADHPLTRGYSCPKGRALGALHHHPRRLDAPRLGDEVTSWDALLDDLAARLRAIVDAHGPDAVAVYHGTHSWNDGFGRMRVEALARHLRTKSIYSAISVDAIARLTVAELVSGLGALVPAIDPDAPALTVLVGTNPVVSHGHAGTLADPVRVLRRIAQGPGLWVLDPRRTETARLGRHLAVRPGADAAVLASVLRELLRDGHDPQYLASHAHADDVARLRAAVEPWDVARAAARADVDERDIDALVDAIRRAGRVIVGTGTGTTMSAEANVVEWLAWAIQIVTGSFEHPQGAWFNPGAHARLDRRDVAAAPAEGRAVPGAPSRPALPGRFGERPCAALADEIEAGNVRALVVVGGDPATALPDHTRLAPLLRTLEVLAVADVVETGTVAAATHVLAVAGPLERDDTNWYTDWFASAICAQRTDAIVPLGADRRAMHEVFTALGARLGLAPDESLLRRSTDRVPELATSPVHLAEPPRVRGWVHERVLPGGRWRVAPPPLVEQLEALGERARDPATTPLVAIPRRAPRRMNSTLHDVARGDDDSALWVHPSSAPGVTDGDEVELSSRAGTIRARARVTTDIREGVVSVPHGLAAQNVALLTSTDDDAVDPLSGMVTQSGFAVSLRPLPR